MPLWLLVGVPDVRFSSARDCSQPRGHAAVLRGVRRGCAAASVALVVVVGAPWVSGSATASAGVPSGSVSSAPSLSAWSFSPVFLLSATPAPLLCETSRGAYPFPTSGASPYSLPSWVSSSDSNVCVQLGGSDLVTPTPTASPAPEPSSSPGETALLSEVQGLRSLYLYSVGLLIFLTAAILFRSRK